jgi:hypothetical protein
LFRALIVKFCADRQLTVDETVVSYLANRIERSYAAVRQAVELLDTEALRLAARSPGRWLPNSCATPDPLAAPIPA